MYWINWAKREYVLTETESGGTLGMPERGFPSSCIPQLYTYPQHHLRLS